MDMCTQHLRTDWAAMDKPTVKDRIIQALSESPWCLNARDLSRQIDVDLNLVTPNLSQMLRESPPRIERHVLAKKYVYLLKVDPNGLNKITELEE